MAQGAPKGTSPISLAVVTAVVSVLLVLFFGLAVAGSYALSLSAIKRAEVTQARINQRELTAQLREAVPTCRDINEMDGAAHVSAEGFPSPPHNAYDMRLSAAIHRVNVDSHCPLILRDVARHVPYTEILRQIRGG